MLRRLEEGKFIPLSYDLMFKKVFGDEKDKRPLKYLLKLILGIDAKELTILNNEILGNRIKSKKAIVDLIVKLDDGTKIEIEMNRTVTQEIFDRNIVFLSRIMSDDLKQGDSYINLDKHIQINFNIRGHRKEPIDHYQIINTKHIDDVLSEKVEFINIDISYFTEKCYNEDADALEELEKIIGLMGIDDKKEAFRIVNGDNIMEDMVRKAEDFSKDEAVFDIYDRDYWVRREAEIEAMQKAEEVIQKAEEAMQKVEESMQKMEEETKEKLEKELEKGLQEGLQKGIEQGIEQIAKNMLNEGVEISFISKVTGLKEEEIDKLRL